MRYLLLTICMAFAFGCGEREEKVKELVYNDPRFDGQQCSCQCNSQTCNQCPSECSIKITNNNCCGGKCEDKEEGDKKEDDKNQPVVIVYQKQDQKQDQNQTSNNTNTNTNTNDIDVVSQNDNTNTNYIKFKCYKPKTTTTRRPVKECGFHGMSCGSFLIPDDYESDIKVMYDRDGNELECYQF